MSKRISRRLATFAAAGSIVLPLVGAAQDLARITDLSTADRGLSYAGILVDNVLVPGAIVQSLTGPTTATADQNLGTFGIVIVPGVTLAGHAPALAAFNRAAAAWTSRISDPITITVNADLAALGAGILGSTSSVVLGAGYNTIRNALVNDAALDADDGIMASTPTAAQFLAEVPSGTGLDGSLLATKANLKAVGFAGLDTAFGVSDASITFSTNFTFDFDNSNGVAAGTTDFETVAAHEIGHALGFVSFVDSVAAGATAISPFTLDLLRFRNDVAFKDPSNSAEFNTFPRSLLGGVDAITDAIGDPEFRMSTGLTGAGSDGSQASHWKADELTGTLIGLMDPTLADGVSYGPSEADFRALDLIGYDITAIPEPSRGAMLVLGLAVFGITRLRRRAGAHAP